MRSESAIKASAILGASAVALGAFGAHALKPMLEETGRLGTWETATLYHLVHAVVLLFLAYKVDWPSAKAAWIALFAGVLVFSGSLYALCLTQVTVLGAITPLGGIALIAGWLLIIRVTGSGSR